jgi:hypothetical protein
MDESAGRKQPHLLLRALGTVSRPTTEKEEEEENLRKKRDEGSNDFSEEGGAFSGEVLAATPSGSGVDWFQLASDLSSVRALFGLP